MVLRAPPTLAVPASVHAGQLSPVNPSSPDPALAPTPVP